MNTPIIAALLLVVALSLSACEKSKTDITAAQPQITAPTRAQPAPEKDLPTEQFPHNPLVTHIYTADPSAHVFNNRLYIYPSHDIDSKSTATGSGARFDMVDYHVLSMTEAGGQVTDHGPALHIGEVPWATKQLWAPDAAEKDGTYYLYFPAKDDKDIFRIGVAKSQKPEGPFVPEQSFIPGTFSIDPAVFKDDDGSHYLYLGGIRGGQLQRWKHGKYTGVDKYPAENQPSLMPYMAKLSDSMVNLAHPLTQISLLDENGNLINQGDLARKFFEAPWVHKFKGTYYLSWSTGDSHTIQYATSDNPYGPFQWRGKLLEPVLGWTNHHSIVEYKGQWHLLYHDSSLSGGVDHLRSVKMTSLTHNADGSIQVIDAWLGD